MRSFCITLFILIMFMAFAGCGGGDREGKQHMVPGLWQSDINDLFARLESEHPGLYRNTTEKELDDARSVLVDSLGVWESEKILVELSRLLAMIGDGATGIERKWLDTHFMRLPVELRYFGSELRVIAAAPGYEIAAGKVLTSLGGKPVSEAVTAIRPLISRDNYAEYLASVPRWISYGEVLDVLGFADDRFTVIAVFTGDDGAEIELSMSTIPPGSFNTASWIRSSLPKSTGVRPAGETQAVVIDITEGDRQAAVVRYFGPDEGKPDTGEIIDESLSELDGTGATRLIADLRGTTSRSPLIADAFVEKSLGWKNSRPGRDIVILVDRRTCCAAIEIAARLGEEDGVTVAGELPRGAPDLTASSETFRLPNSGVRVTFSTAYHTPVPVLAGSPWLPLDIHVRETWNDHTSGYDAPLDTALAAPTPAPPSGEGEDSVLVDMVLIPAAEYTMGGREDDIYAPPHKVFVDSFYIDRYEVTNAQYQKFCEETGKNWPEFWGMDEYHCGPDWPGYPVVGVSLYQARLFAEWAGKRIPTEAEWELAARGGLIDVKFPTGDELLPTDGNYRVGPDFIGTVPVGCYPPNGYGLYDMAGNVVEWVNDYFHPDFYRTSPYRNPTGPEKGYIAVIRGGGWHSGRMCCNVYTRNAVKYSWVDIAVGFRCASDVEGRQEQDSRRP
jgi:formylglycine-generating enzyme required for sulfatase activity